MKTAKTLRITGAAGSGGGGVTCVSYPEYHPSVSSLSLLPIFFPHCFDFSALGNKIRV